MNKTADQIDRLKRISGHMQNIGDAVEEELGYVKSILAAVLLMAETDAHRFSLEIVSLVKRAHWAADNLEANVDYMSAEIVSEARVDE
jgi:DNA-binding FrmR family transcriptional regulator